MSIKEDARHKLKNFDLHIVVIHIENFETDQQDDNKGSVELDSRIFTGDIQ